MESTMPFSGKRLYTPAATTAPNLCAFNVNQGVHMVERWTVQRPQCAMNSKKVGLGKKKEKMLKLISTRDPTSRVAQVRTAPIVGDMTTKHYMA